jgi:hypothetical protein
VAQTRLIIWLLNMLLEIRGRLMVTGDIANTGAVADAGERPGETRARGNRPGAERAVRGCHDRDGNDDVPRIPKEQRQLSRLIEKLRAGEATLEAARHSPGDHDLLATRMAAYEKFAAAFGPGAGTMGCWTTTRETDDGLSIRLSGLSTSLLCTDDQDEGRLLCGQWQLKEIGICRVPSPSPPANLAVSTTRARSRRPRNAP